MRLILITMSLIIALVVFSAVMGAFGIHVPYVSEAIAGLTGNAGLGTARNVISDSPVRRAGGPPPQENI